MKKNILLIDDNKYLLDVFVIRLTMGLRNYKVLTARNGKRGIEILKSARIEFVLTDLDMPEMDGYQFIEYAQKHFPEIPVYAMSNDCSPEIGQRLRSLGITECIEKPFLVEEVTNRIMKRLKGEKAGAKEQPSAPPDGAYVLSIIPN
ncbi:MAG: hypothetical protein A2010_04145 [Nitrospirae bacterium GWD2_57_9]|nr:MAG: hypothetical protein A2010_04145 [Nitrospirae bacterium GWD2_57_9]OGW47763.1 MAG: hypothetical protein A2078_13145 [Nitrospirae bacterium GWC2_57_9]